MNLRVAVVHPQLVPGGGSEACAMWTLQALQDRSRLTLITMGCADLLAMNRKYGTTIDPGRIDGRFLRIPLGTKRRFDALRGYRLARYCRRHARDFDVMISAYNVMDFGVAGIQMIADFSFDDALRRELHSANGPARVGLYRASAARSLYLGLARSLAGNRGDGWKKNRTTANSEWTRDLLRERFGVDSEVVYPPVVGAFPPFPWNEREDGFVVIGRLVPEKGLRRVVEILVEVRKENRVHLHILGRRERSAHAREVEELCLRNRDWVHLEGEKYGPEKAEFLARHKYGISGCRNEAFGIAVAEMVKAGCLVWVPDGGGQTEIVAHPRLVFSDPDDAARKILAVLADPEKQASLRGHLETRAGLFSTERFVRETRALVRAFLEGNRAGAS